jgi:hypothetical protein
MTYAAVALGFALLIGFGVNPVFPDNRRAGRDG